MLCRLKKLWLIRGALSGAELLRFVSRSPPQLNTLNLDRVCGIDNKDLLDCLCLVAPTLVTLRIQECDILPLDGDEFALDAVMPQMSKLENVMLRGKLASTLAIARKRYVDHPQGPKRSTFTFTTDYSTFAMHDLPNALAATGWEEVVLKWDPPLDRWREGSVSCSLMFGGERSILLKCMNGSRNRRWF